MKRLVPARPRRRASPRFVSLVDVLTVLLVFLLLSYSSDQSIRPSDSSFVLPTSAHNATADPARALDITLDGIYLDGFRRTGVRWYLEHDEDLVREIYGALQQRPGERLQLRADASVPYRVVRKVLFTARQAGIEDITLVARSRSSL